MEIQIIIVNILISYSYYYYFLLLLLVVVVVMMMAMIMMIIMYNISANMREMLVRFPYYQQTPVRCMLLFQENTSSLTQNCVV